MPTLSTAVAAAAAADNSSATVFIPAAQLAAAAAAAATQEEGVASPDDIAVGRKLKQQFTIPDNRQRITPTTSWPHMAMGKLVYDLDANRTNYGCSAAFISPDEILTAGHCTLDAASGRPYNLRSFTPGKDDALEPMGRWVVVGVREGGGRNSKLTLPLHMGRWV
jgi:V8-like Glu-specific endopeptidase